jgi:hypothetical protein
MILGLDCHNELINIETCNLCNLLLEFARRVFKSSLPLTGYLLLIKKSLSHGPSNSCCITFIKVMFHK